MSPRADPRPRLLQKLDTAWADFGASYAGLADAELLVPGVVGSWSVKDILALVTTWEEEALKYLPLILTGGRPPRYATYGGINAFNARMAEQKRALSLAEVQQQLADTHRQLLEFIQSVPPDQLAGATRFRHRLRLDTYRHYAEHANAIRTWREQRSTG